MRLRSILGLASVSVLLAGMAGCKKDDGASETQEGYAVLLRTATDPSADYVLTTNDLMSGSISSTGTGYEQAGWSYMVKASDTYIAIDYTNNIATGYRVQEGLLSEVSQFAYERLDCFGPAPDGKAIGIGAPWGGGSFDCEIQVIDGSTVGFSNSITTPIYAPIHNGTQINSWPTACWVQSGKLYVPFYPLIGDTWETPQTDTAYVTVYSYPDLEYETTFKDTRTGPIGYYSGQPCVIEDENGNHYTFSSTSSAAGFTQSTKPAGILKINSGATSFDSNYFFDTEALGYKVLGGKYVGNGIVVARVISTTMDGIVPAWAAFQAGGTSAPACNIAIVDLNAKTITPVADVPNHGGQYLTPFLLEDGKVYTSITIGAAADGAYQEAWIYEIDPTSATATQGARIEGFEVQAMYKY